MSSVDLLDSVQQAKQAQLHQQVAIAVMAQGLKAARLEGAAANELLEATAQLSKELGKGGNLDLMA